ncbi:MAG: hypothetical protein RL172_1688 [Bacteroidota bacterium]
MLLLKRMPRLPKWILSVMIVFLAMMTLLRLVFFFSYNPPGKAFSGSAFIMGLRFDLKFTCILGLAMLALCALPFLNPFKWPKAKWFWNSVLTIVFLAMLIFYVVDYFHFDYLHQRLNASVFSYFQAEDAKISMDMGLQSYPVFTVIFLLLLATIASALIFRTILVNYQTRYVLDKRKGIGWYIGFFALLGLGVFGKIGQFNLRWSDAFTLSDTFKANLALNPFQSFFSTLRYRDTRPDEARVRAYYPLMVDYLNVQQADSTKLNYQRHYNFNPANNTQKPNVILVICESFCMFRSSMAGNPYNTTPYFNTLCQQGIFFERCFTPSFPTARGVWATITGIPDVLGDNNRTASRNPEVVNQQTIINDFKGYQKFYFLGGDPTWANIKGLLMNNIDSLQLYSQQDFKAKKVDVWGIDDKSLLLESSQILGQQKKPFFAIIQTADNHRPYTIPEADLKEFKKVNYPEDSVKKYGFEDNAQLNAFRYTDYCFEKFMDAAKKQPYFDNTIFVFVGDHGLPGNANSMYPRSWTEQSLTREHVPLLFYAPKILKPQLVSSVCSQSDVLASVATLLKQPYTNNSMGQSLFDTRIKYPEGVFIIDHEARTIGMVTNEYYYQQNTKTGKQTLVSVVNSDAVPQNYITDSVKQRLAMLTQAYHQTAKYLLFNNKPK